MARSTIARSTLTSNSAIIDKIKSLESDISSSNSKLNTISSDIRLLTEKNDSQTDKILKLDENLKALSNNDMEYSANISTLRHYLQESLDTFTTSLNTQREEHKKFSMEQELRWRDTSNKLAEESLQKMQDMAIQLISRKFIDWLWTALFASAMGGVGWLVTHFK